jgi:hypothetical protein
MKKIVLGLLLLSGVLFGVGLTQENLQNIICNAYGEDVEEYGESMRQIFIRKGYSSKNLEEKVQDMKEGFSGFCLKEKKLTINPSPSNARVRIMNIRPKYRDGIELKKGSYRILIDAKGYKTYDNWIELSKDTTLDIKLEKK